MFKNFDWRHALALVACGIVLGIGQIPQVKSFDAILYGVASPLFLYAGMALPQIGGAAKDAAKKLGAVLMLLALTHSTTACISSAPVVPVTPANQAQISSCQSTAAAHNGFVVGDFTVGALGAASGILGAAVTDTGQKTAFSTGAAVASGTAGVLTALAAFAAKNFANSHCTEVVGDLPLGHAKAAGGLR